MLYGGSLGLSRDLHTTEESYCTVVIRRFKPRLPTWLQLVLRSKHYLNNHPLVFFFKVSNMDALALMQSRILPRLVVTCNQPNPLTTMSTLLLKSEPLDLEILTSLFGNKYIKGERNLKLRYSQ